MRENSRTSLERLIEEQVRGIEQEMLATARRKLALVLDDGQRGEGHSSDEAVYAACRAYIAVYDRLMPEEGGE